MLRTGPTICDSRDGSCKYGCTAATGCSGETWRREHAQPYLQARAEQLVTEIRRNGFLLSIDGEAVRVLKVPS